MTLKFSYLPTKLGFLLTGTLAVGALTAGVILGMNPNAPQPASFDGTEYPTQLSSLINGCGNVFGYEPEAGYQYAELTEEILNKMDREAEIPEGPMIVPVYGYLATEPLEEKDIRFYELEETEEENIPLEKVLRTMYSYDTLVIWYTEGIAATDLVDIKTYASENENTLVLPYTYKNGKLPLDRNVAFSKWGVSQSCNVFTVPGIQNFLEIAEEHGPEGGNPEIPEARFVKNTNILWPILPSDYDFKKHENN